MARIKKANRNANFCREMALLSATGELLFHGNIIVQPRDEAAATAAKSTGSGINHQHRVFWVDGSTFTHTRLGAPHVGKASGAAVVYQSPRNEVWHEMYLGLKGQTCTNTELAAIAEGLATAVSEMLPAKDQNTAEPGGALLKVTIFTDCQDALYSI
jgi:hypothetical protein